MSSNNILKVDDNENFLKEFLKSFYRQIINIENYTKYENILITPELKLHFIISSV